MNFCEYYQKSECRICNKLDINYAEQLIQKRLELENILNTKCDEVIASKQWQIRDKIKLQITGSLTNFKIGFLDPDELIVKHEIMTCPLQNPYLNQLVQTIRPLIIKYNIYPYDIKKRNGELKGLIVFHSPTTNQTYLRFILRSKESIERLQKMTLELNQVNCISANIQPTAHAILEGKEEIYLKGNSIHHQYNDKLINLSPQGFVQTNTFVAAKLYTKANEWLKDYHFNQLVDLFCGHGLFSFHLEDIAEKITGIEISEEAIQMAKRSATDFNYKTLFISQDARLIFSELKKINPDLIVVNPPRAGLRELAKQLQLIKPRYLLYSSCNAQTLKNDYDKLREYYTIKKMALFDMFPNSAHYEVLCLLQAK
jgi:23S rRNA (uracil747-C5)-methyltransferase